MDTPPPPASIADLDQLRDRLRRFSQERDWDQFHSPKNLAMALIAISNYGFAVGESFTASFLPELGPPDKLGKISGFAWGLGYFGGLLAAGTIIFLEVANPKETLPKARAHQHSTAIMRAAKAKKHGGQVIAETPGYDNTFQRPLIVIDHREST